MLIAYGFDGCPNDTAYRVIQIIGSLITIYIPNAFTPNGDGTNDFFCISGTDIASYSYNIYNRWGDIFSRQLLVIHYGTAHSGMCLLSRAYIFTRSMWLMY